MVFPISYPWESLRTLDLVFDNLFLFCFFLFNCKIPSLASHANVVQLAPKPPDRVGPEPHGKRVETGWALMLENVLCAAARQGGCGDKGQQGCHRKAQCEAQCQTSQL